MALTIVDLAVVYPSCTSTYKQSTNKVIKRVVSLYTHVILQELSCMY